MDLLAHVDPWPEGRPSERTDPPALGFDPLSGLPTRPARASVVPYRDATGLTAEEVHALLSDGQTLRMSRRQYLATVTSDALTRTAREDIARFYRMNDLRVAGA